MIHRLIYEDWPLIFPVTALMVAALIAAAAVWRTVGTKPAESRCPAGPPRESE